MKNSEDCVHYYILPLPDGRECLGVCRDCGDEKVHYNSHDKAKRPHKNPNNGNVFYTHDLAMMPKRPLNHWFNTALK
jgi:hypothetical protein